MLAPMSDGLVDEVARRLGPKHPRWLAVRVAGGHAEVASQGIEHGADVEIGSISKGLTGLLYVDAIERGEVRPDTTLADLLPLGATPAGGVTLASLATHTSGLPRLAADSGALAATWRLWREGTNPYGASLDDLLQRTRETRVGRPRPAYSNLGFMLLGHGIAAAAGMTYAELFAQRLAEPLGLSGAHVPATAAELSPHAVVGTNGRGRPMEAWTGVGVGPAGGIRMTASDLAALIGALLDGTAPGLAALDPVQDFGGRANRIGAGWMTMATKTGDVTWHNGGTGGFRSILTLDRARQVGVAIVTATSRSVDRHGFDLVKEQARLS